MDIVIDGDVVTLPLAAGSTPAASARAWPPTWWSTEVLAAGAAGVCVNLGGDLRASGASHPERRRWTVAVEHPTCRQPARRPRPGRGAVATSTTLRRRWTVDGEPRHHLIDPGDRAPEHDRLELVTVVAGEAWQAEVLAKAVPPAWLAASVRLIDGSGPPAALIVDTAVGCAVPRAP